MFATSQCVQRRAAPCACHARPPVQRRAAPASQATWRHLATSARVSQPHDPSEREADRVADAVMNGRGATGVSAAPGGAVQRACAACDAAERVGGSDYLGHIEGKGQPLPSAVRHDLEPRFGVDFSDVRVHTDSRAAASAVGYNALAYTYGRHLVFGPGQFDAASSGGRRLIAHELAHVVQQSGGGPRAVQRQFGPLDLELDVCVTLPDPIGTKCGSDAAEACSKMWIPGCDKVCKIFGCKKPPKPSMACPPGWRPGGAKGFEGLCCRGTIDSAKDCCTADRVATFDGRCCGPTEDVVDGRCTKRKEEPPFLPCPFPGKPTLTGKCCLPPDVPKGLDCGPPDPVPPPPVPKPPAPVLPVLPPIFFKQDRPIVGEGAASLPSATTAIGNENFDALVAALTKNPDLKVQLIGRASPEGEPDYNLKLGARRARMVAAALNEKGLAGRIANPPTPGPEAACTPLETAGTATCGEAGASGEEDRQVQVRVFDTSVP